MNDKGEMANKSKGSAGRTSIKNNVVDCSDLLGAFDKLFTEPLAKAQTTSAQNKSGAGHVKSNGQDKRVDGNHSDDDMNNSFDGSFKSDSGGSDNLMQPQHDNLHDMGGKVSNDAHDANCFIEFSGWQHCYRHFC